MSDVVLHIGPDQRCCWASPSVTRLLGWRPEELIGRSREEMVHPDDLARLVQARISPVGQSMEVQYRFRCASGSYRWVSGVLRRLTPSEDGLAGQVVTVRDAEAEVAAKQGLEASEARLRMVVEGSRDAISLTRFGVVEWISPAIETIIGWPAGQLVGCNLREFVHPDDVKLFDEARRERSESAAIALRCRLRHRAGGWHWVGVNIRPIPNGDPEGPSRAVSNWRLIDEEVAAIDALKESEERNRGHADQLEHFLVVMSHELRNPVAAMQGAADLLTGAVPADSSQARYCAILTRQLAHLRRLLDDLLDVARARSGQLALTRRPWPLQQLVLAAVEMVRPILEQRHQRLDLDQPQVDCLVRVDHDRLVQAIANVLRNASLYTDPGGSISVVVGSDEGGAFVTVTDTGIGIEEHMLDAVFEPLVRAPAAAARVPGGLGVGLPLVRSLVELHGGSVTAQSLGRGRGSSFRLRLPLEGGDVDPAAIATAPQARPGRRVLLVEDNADVAEVLADLLTELGHTVERVATGAEALGAFDRSLPDLVLLDLGLPDVAGHDLARLLRGLPGGEGPVLVAVTGWGSEADVADSAAAGIDVHLVKPVGLRQLATLPFERPQRTSRADTEAAS